MFQRTEILILKDKLEKLNNSHVAIFGIGGVGGHVAEMLVRAGIGNITIVDFDKVDKTNLNRQIIALHSTIGKYKVDVMKERLHDINPNLKITTIKEKYLPENRDMFFENKYDYVVDAIDMVTSKVDLIKYCHDLNLNIISAMGAGNRYVVPDFEVVDIFKTFNDGLAKIVRKKLKELGINKHKVAFTENIANPSQDVIGSISYYPAMCGCVIAGYVINELIKWLNWNKLT